MPQTEPIQSSSSKPEGSAAIASKPRFAQSQSLLSKHHSNTKAFQWLALGLQMALLAVASTSILYGLLDWSLFAWSKGFHPAQIPWLTTQDSCEQTGRTWQQGRCVDYEHDPRF